MFPMTGDNVYNSSNLEVNFAYIWGIDVINEHEMKILVLEQNWLIENNNNKANQMFKERSS